MVAPGDTSEWSSSLPDADSVRTPPKFGTIETVAVRECRQQTGEWWRGAGWFPDARRPGNLRCEHDSLRRSPCMTVIEDDVALWPCGPRRFVRLTEKDRGCAHAGRLDRQRQQTRISRHCHPEIMPSDHDRWSREDRWMIPGREGEQEIAASPSSAGMGWKPEHGALFAEAPGRGRPKAGVHKVTALQIGIERCGMIRPARQGAPAREAGGLVETGSGECIHGALWCGKAAARRMAEYLDGGTDDLGGCGRDVSCDPSADDYSGM